MEISAVIAGLHWIKKNLPEERAADVYSDSSLVIATMTKNWKRKKNLDLWKKLDSLIPHFQKLGWHLVKGHAWHRENEQADKIAFREAKKVAARNS